MVLLLTRPQWIRIKTSISFLEGLKQNFNSQFRWNASPGNVSCCNSTFGNVIGAPAALLNSSSSTTNSSTHISGIPAVEISRLNLNTSTNSSTAIDAGVGVPLPLLLLSSLLFLLYRERKLRLRTRTFIPNPDQSKGLERVSGTQWKQDHDGGAPLELDNVQKAISELAFQSESRACLHGLLLLEW